MNERDVQTLVPHLALIADVYSRAFAVPSGKGRMTTVNELTDQMPAARPEVLRSAVEVLVHIADLPPLATKVLSEEDKGAVLAGMFSSHLFVFLPLAMARHNVPYDIPGSIVVPLSMEYMDGQLTVNGVKKGDQLILIDDTLASGGTMISLIKAARAAGAEVVDVRVVIEKIGYGGREAVLAQTGLDVKAGLGIQVDEGGVVTVVEALGRPAFEVLGPSVTATR